MESIDWRNLFGKPPEGFKQVIKEALQATEKEQQKIPSRRNRKQVAKRKR